MLSPSPSGGGVRPRSKTMKARWSVLIQAVLLLCTSCFMQPPPVEDSPPLSDGGSAGKGSDRGGSGSTVMPAAGDAGEGPVALVPGCPAGVQARVASAPAECRP